MTVSSLSGISGAAPFARSGESATDLARAIVGAMVDPALLGIGRAAAFAAYFPPSGETLAPNAAASRFAAASGAGDAVTLGRYEVAALDFAGAARALLVGGVDRSPDSLAATIDAALDAGSRHASGGVALDVADALYHAAHLLGEQGAGLLIVSPITEEF